jgi:hypothetical protein
MAKKTYKVVGPYAVYGTAPGETVRLDLSPGEEQLHLEAGTLEIGKGEDDKAEKVPCPACVEQKLSRPPKFDDLEDLRQHYADKHPALVAPDELPEPAEKEE